MALKIPAFRGHHPPLLTDAEYTDYRLWELGIRRHWAEHHHTGQERTYLRGLHTPLALRLLRGALSRPAWGVRLTSCWVDRHPQAHPLPAGANCEIGDLLVVVRYLVPQAVGVRVNAQRALLLQAKTADHPVRIAHTDPSTRNEIALYTACQHLALRHFKAVLGTFDLSRDAHLNRHPSSDWPHWKFLQFCRDDVEYQNGVWPPSPIQSLWPLPVTGHAQASSLTTTMQRLVVGDRDVGADMDALVNPEWTRLCETLLRFTQNRVSRLAGGSWQHHAFETLPGRLLPADQAARLTSADMEFRQTGFLFARHPQARSLADAMRSAVRQSAQRPPEPPQDSHIDDFPPGEDAGMSTLLIDIVTEQDWVPANG
ncbi:hypothetical protein ACI2S5_11220 [Ralstonia nicotianae]|uniref:Uncharacterized protein n=1 Tax=Ralstonia solanacearum TaxID=305 RepID=A0A0S4UE16_RALSL|nr:MULTISPECIES: hypothetical protein [Ralstonia]NKA06199.1 peroxidase [Ralstonia solanacearum]MDO3516130.1 hypothetical protein [Ralstonia pseudosolanacearum]MDO3543675.1 hypothetical protein [Ralstonia pseudosolanacearum]NKA55132.1 peroxidase [Ralstonia solanacearum]NKA67146.1 peroxidase [Ralstonia solanacearum]